MDEQVLPLCVTGVAVAIIVALAGLVAFDFFQTRYSTAIAQSSDDCCESDPPPPSPESSDDPPPPSPESSDEPPPPSPTASSTTSPTPTSNVLPPPSPTSDGGGGTVTTRQPTPTFSPSPTPKSIIERSLDTAPPIISQPAKQAAEVASRVANPAVTTTVATVATVSTAASIASAAASSSSSVGLLGLLQSIFPFLAIRRRNEPWGRVTEEGTNAPVKGAVVTIIDKANRPRATVKTRADGTFGVLLPGGEYQIVVNKPGYIVPPTPKHVALFPGEHIYTQGYINTSDEKILKAIVIPLRRKGGAKSDWLARWRRGLAARWRIFQARWATPILVVGAMLNTVSLAQNPTLFATVLSIFYVILLLIELALSRTLEHAIGHIYDGLSKQPVSLALVRLVDAINRQIVATEVSSPKGQFLLRPRSGTYRLQVAHNKYQPYINENFHIKRQFMRGGKVQISLDPRGGGQPLPPAERRATAS